jgi:hypothetical protein
LYPGGYEAFPEGGLAAIAGAKKPRAPASGSQEYLHREISESRETKAGQDALIDRIESSRPGALHRDSCIALIANNQK